eukprot:6173093-Pleurochrysis_carterae.AAC.1
MSGLPFVMSVSSFSARHLAPRQRVATRLLLINTHPLAREGVHNLPPPRAASALCRAVQHLLRRAHASA